MGSLSAGANRLAGNIETMIGRRPPLYFVICWKFITPALLCVSLIYSFYCNIFKVPMKKCSKIFYPKILQC